MALQLEIKSRNSKELVEKFSKVICPCDIGRSVVIHDGGDRVYITISDSIGNGKDLKFLVDAHDMSFVGNYVTSVCPEALAEEEASMHEEVKYLERAKKMALDKIDAIHAELRENIGGENWNEELEITKEKIGIMYNKMQCIQKLEKICGETLTAEYTMLDIEREDLIERKYYIDKKLNELSSLRYILRVLGEDENPDPNALM